ncbi:hypothetical protein FPZ08_06905 [Devosia ginsengisoli]|uniref:Lipoprotein n=1 Tax=Devosia ginsengisoli TaxID=400770 RepID=A0A5B8LTA1_9HYPH|nr:hypothetical protein FPZ08_06905 [Devosia ginsengisoli]
MKSISLAAMMLMSVLLAGCATTSGDFCDVASPIRPSVQDQVTDGTKRQIVAHNDYGSRACGWKS